MNSQSRLRMRVRSRRTILYVTMLCAAASLAMVAAAVPGHPAVSDDTPNVTTLKELSRAFATVTERVSPAVVSVQVQKTQTVSAPNVPFGDGSGAFNDEFLKKFFGDRLPQFKLPNQPRQSMGLGSGFIISEEGYILTNHHVVGDASRVRVTLADGREFDAAIVGTDARSDVAVVKIEGKDLPVLGMGNSDDVDVGEWVLALGSPFGLSGTVTSGIVSAKGRSSVGIADYENFIQTDAAINPGNSGGPLINLRGEAIGINTAIASRNGGYMGVGFAIPINMAHEICDQLIKSGSVTRGYLGIVIQNLTPDLIKSFGIGDAGGVLVGDVNEDSPGGQAGLKPGDVIVRYNGQDVKDVASFRNRVARTTPDSEARVELIRNGKRQQLTVKIGRLPTSGAPELSGKKSNTIDSLGLTVGPLTEQLAEQLGYAEKSGVVVSQVEPGSKAALAGVQPGSLIEEVDRKPVSSVDEFRKSVEEASKDGLILFRVKRGDFSGYVTVRLKD